MNKKAVEYSNINDKTAVQSKIERLSKQTAVQSKGISVIMVPPELIGKPKSSRTAFISYPKNGKGGPYISLHLSNKGASQLVKLFGKEYHDNKFTGLTIKKLGYNKIDDTITIMIE